MRSVAACGRPRSLGPNERPAGRLDRRAPADSSWLSSRGPPTSASRTPNSTRRSADTMRSFPSSRTADSSRSCATASAGSAPSDSGTNRPAPPPEPLRGCARWSAGASPRSPRRPTSNARVPPALFEMSSARTSSTSRASSPRATRTACGRPGCSRSPPRAPSSRTARRARTRLRSHSPRSGWRSTARARTSWACRTRSPGQVVMARAQERGLTNIRIITRT